MPIALVYKKYDVDTFGNDILKLINYYFSKFCFNLA